MNLKKHLRVSDAQSDIDTNIDWSRANDPKYQEFVRKLINSERKRGADYEQAYSRVREELYGIRNDCKDIIRRIDNFLNNW